MKLFCCFNGGKVLDEKYAFTQTASLQSTGNSSEANNEKAVIEDSIHFFPTQEDLNLTTDQNGTILRANQIAHRILKYLPMEIKGKNITAILANKEDRFFILSFLIFDFTINLKDNPRMKKPFTLVGKEQNLISGTLKLSHGLNSRKEPEITFSLLPPPYSSPQIIPEEKKTPSEAPSSHGISHWRLPGSVSNC
jgi:hypothetical protein